MSLSLLGRCVLLNTHRYFEPGYPQFWLKMEVGALDNAGGHGGAYEDA